MNALKQLHQHPTCIATQRVNEICAPLFTHLQVQDFSYSLIYPDGSRSFLCSNREIVLDPVLHDIYNSKKHNSKLWVDFKPFGSMYGYFSSDISKMLENDSSRASQFSLTVARYYRKHYRIGDRLIITTKMPDLAENFMFHFAEETPCKLICLNNYELLKKFCLYFKEMTKTIINEIRYKPIIMPCRNQKIFFNTDVSPLLIMPRSSEFITSIAENTNFINNLTSKINLTKKEKKYAQYIIKGFSAREISEHCYVSKRTIETHIVNMKNKLGVTSRSQLIGKLLKNGVGINDILVS